MAAAVEECSFLDGQGAHRNFASDVRGATENQLIGVDLALDDSIYSGQRHVNLCGAYVGSRTYRKCPVLGCDLPTKGPVNPQSRLKADLAGKLHDITYEAQPIIPGDIYARSAFLTSRYCLRTHSYLFSICSEVKTRRGKRQTHCECESGETKN